MADMLINDGTLVFTYTVIGLTVSDVTGISAHTCWTILGAPCGLISIVPVVVRLRFMTVFLV